MPNYCNKAGFLFLEDIGFNIPIFEYMYLTISPVYLQVYIFKWVKKFSTSSHPHNLTPKMLSGPLFLYTFPTGAPSAWYPLPPAQHPHTSAPPKPLLRLRRSHSQDTLSDLSAWRPSFPACSFITLPVCLSQNITRTKFVLSLFH